MRYTIDVMLKTESGEYRRVATTTDPHLTDFLADFKSQTLLGLFNNYILHVTDHSEKTTFAMHDLDAYESWILALERYQWHRSSTQMPPGVESIPTDKAVNPDYYRGMLKGLPDLGWLDIESRKEKYSNPVVFLAAVDLQESKYMERLGRKDSPLQERKKSLFYKMYAILYMENNCQPITADLVHTWLAAMPSMPGECM
jgi:hypothetical protein